MSSAGRPLWQRVTALVSLSMGGAVTGFSFVPGAVADLTTPTSMPIRLMALEQSAQPSASDDALLRSAIVNVASYYLRMAQGKTPAEMEQIIWQQDSLDGIDHGASCAAFASLTLELGAQVVGQRSWVTGGTSYPWPLHTWADVRVDPNPSSLGITSILQDAQASHRWHPLGDGYQPMPGDWVLFDGHVEVVTKYAGGTLYTIGGDSLPNFSVNAHEYPAPLDAQGVAGFVDNGQLAAARQVTPSSDPVPAVTPSPQGQQAQPQENGTQPQGQPTPENAAVPQGNAAQPQGQAAYSQEDSAQPQGQAAQPRENAGQPHADAAQPQPDVAVRPGSAVQPDGDAGPPPDSSGVPQGQLASGQAAIPGVAPAAEAPAAEAPAPAAEAPQTWSSARAAATPAPSPRRSGPTLRRRPAAGRAHDPRRIWRPGRPDAVPGADADVPGTGPAWSAAVPAAAAPGSAAVPGLPTAAHHRGAVAPPAPQSQAGQSLPAASSGVTDPQQAFIDSVAPGAMAAQRNYGVPAAVTIAQAIEESGWGQSGLAVRDHNLFGIKGQGPAGSDMLPTQEFENGQMVNRTAIFRVYHNVAESIDDHGKLLATSGYYRQAMAERLDPDRFAASLTGIYATDPAYGDKLIVIMQRYNLYRFDAARPAGPPAAAPRTPRVTAPGPAAGGASIPGVLPHADPAPSSAPPQPARPGHTLHHHRRVHPGHRVRPVQQPLPASSPMPSPDPQPVQPTPAPAPFPPLATPQPGPSRRAMPAHGRPSGPVRSRPKPAPPVQLVSGIQVPAAAGRPLSPAASRMASVPARHPRQHIPLSVRNAFLATARGPIRHAEPLYRDVASHCGIHWELLAASDWMQCESRPRFSPVHGEKLGTLNPDGTVYHTKSEALEQVADDLIDLASAVYRIDLTAPMYLSVRDLANVFAAFRWGGLLRMHRTSAMEFPYSVAGLTDHHTNMRWPNIDEPSAPDKPGARFSRPFGAVPVVLSLGYPAID